MKLYNFLKISVLILVFISVSQKISAQQTTTLNKVNKIEREKELKKKEMIRAQANPVNKSNKRVRKNAQVEYIERSAISEEEAQEMDNEIKKLEADLAKGKKQKSLSSATIKEKEKVIEAKKIELKKKKTPIIKKQKAEISN